jgi:hypothetical protein
MPSFPLPHIASAHSQPEDVIARLLLDDTAADRATTLSLIETQLEVIISDTTYRSALLALEGQRAERAMDRLQLVRFSILRRFRAVLILYNPASSGSPIVVHMTAFGGR